MNTSLWDYVIMKIKIYAFIFFVFCYTGIGYIYFCFRLTEIRIKKMEDGLISTKIGIQFCKIVNGRKLILLNVNIVILWKLDKNLKLDTLKSIRILMKGCKLF